MFSLLSYVRKQYLFTYYEHMPSNWVVNRHDHIYIYMILLFDWPFFNFLETFLLSRELALYYSVGLTSISPLMISNMRTDIYMHQSKLSYYILAVRWNLQVGIRGISVVPVRRWLSGQDVALSPTRSEV